MYRKSNGAESRLAYLGHLLIENRHGLIADAMVTIADGYAEREAATLMVCAQWEHAPARRRTVGADQGYDAGDFVGLMRELNTTPHVTQNLTRAGASAIDARTTRHAAYAISQHARPRQGGLALCLRECRVQFDPAAKAAAETGVMQAMCVHRRTTRPSTGRPTRAAGLSRHRLSTR